MVEPTQAVLSVRDVHVHFGKGAARRQILGGVSFDIAHGESVGLIGETGSGKSTIARTILGLVRASSGAFSVEGVDVARLSGRALRAFRRQGLVQYVFQDPLKSLDPDLSVADSLAEPLRIRGTLSSAEVASRVDEYLRKVNLPADVGPKFPTELSGGQRQRVALARGLITEPKLLILDEPVSALDSANRVQMLRLLEQLRSTGVSMLFISHDLGSVAGITDRTLVLYRGQVVEDAPTSRVINAPVHPYTQLLIGSAPTLSSSTADRDRRRALREELSAVAASAAR